MLPVQLSICYFFGAYSKTVFICYFFKVKSKVKSMWLEGHESEERNCVLENGSLFLMLFGEMIAKDFPRTEGCLSLSFDEKGAVEDQLCIQRMSAICQKIFEFTKKPRRVTRAHKESILVRKFLKICFKKTR